ncbi:MAG TPA: helix-turn-helix domain-containing protein [Dehalococcoidia bacterium]|nr:helix-turn-helix domain-containing protein [Dehalococcoidia bacterium]
MAKNYTRNNKNNHRWTEDETLIVRRDYKGDKASTQAIADGLGVSFYAVKGQVSKMGITFQDRQYWTKREEERLRELMPRYAPTRVAKIMHRCLNSVVLKSKRLGISRRTRYGWFTKQEVCEILGVDHKWLQKRIDSGSLKARYHYPYHKPGKLGMASWEIDEKDLVRYIRRYPQDLMGRNVDIIQIVEMLAGLLNHVAPDNEPDYYLEGR